MTFSILDKNITLDLKGSNQGCKVSYHVCNWNDENQQTKRKYVYCVHRLAGRASEFYYLAERLIEDDKSRVVVCIDIPGRGDSDYLQDPTGYEYSNYVSIVLKVVETESPSQEIDYVGTSMGGLIGVSTLIARHHSQPSVPRLFRSFVINDIGPYVPCDALQQIGSYIEKMPLSFQSFQEGHDYFKTVYRGFGYNLTDDQWKYYSSKCIVPSKENPSIYRFHFDRNIMVNFSKVVQDIDLWAFWPTIVSNIGKMLILRGDESNILPKSVYDKMISSSSNVYGKEFPDVAHAPSLLVNDQIDSILSFYQESGNL